MSRGSSASRRQREVSDDANTSPTKKSYEPTALDLVHHEGAKILKKYKVGTLSFDRAWRSTFGASSKVCAKLWTMVDQEACDVVHLLWSLYYLKCYPTEIEAALFLGGFDKATVRDRI